MIRWVHFILVWYRCGVENDLLCDRIQQLFPSISTCLSTKAFPETCAFQAWTLLHCTSLPHHLVWSRIGILWFTWYVWQAWQDLLLFVIGTVAYNYCMLDGVKQYSQIPQYTSIMNFTYISNTGSSTGLFHGFSFASSLDLYWWNE